MLLLTKFQKPPPIHQPFCISGELKGDDERLKLGVWLKNSLTTSEVLTQHSSIFLLSLHLSDSQLYFILLILNYAPQSTIQTKEIFLLEYQPSFVNA